VNSRHQTRSGLLLAVTLGAAALAGCGQGGEAAQGSNAGPGGRSGARITAVQVAPVEVGSIARSVTVSGILEPIRTVAVNSQVSGALLSVHVEEGSAVREGEVLARFDDRELRAQLAAAEAAYQVAASAYERAQQLRERKVITLPEYERDRTAFAAAQAELEQIRTRVGYTTVTAPISGVVTEKRVEAGDAVGQQTRLFTLADVSTMVVRVGISELDVVELRVGDPVDVALDAFPDRHFRGRIRRVFPAADPATRLVPVEVALEGESARIVRPGFLARATFALGAREHVLLVPAAAIVRGTGSEAVFIISDGKALRRGVTTGLTSEGRVEILSGLSAGEQIVVAGNSMLRDGAPVRVIEDRQAAGATAPRTVQEGRS